MAVVLLQHVEEVFVRPDRDECIKIFWKDLVLDYKARVAEYAGDLLFQLIECDGARDRDDASLTADVFELAISGAREDLATVTAEEFYPCVWG